MIEKEEIKYQQPLKKFRLKIIKNGRKILEKPITSVEFHKVIDICNKNKI